MTAVHWFLPTSGDGRQVNPPERPADLDYLVQVARAAEYGGFEAMLTPTGINCEDAWVSVAALARETTRLKFLVAFRPGFVLPTVAAQMAATLQRHLDGRLLLNVVTGGDSVEQRGYGDFLSKDERYARTAEFLDVVQASWTGQPFDYAGAHYRVEGGRLRNPPAVLPSIYFGGASPAAEDVAASYAEVGLMWGEPPAAIAERVDRVRTKAAALGRTPRFGVRLHVIARDSEAEAWREAQRLLDAMPPELIAAKQAHIRQAESAGQRRQAALVGGAPATARDLEVSPGLWSGIGLVRDGAGTALVGSYDRVAELIEGYRAVGVEEFILSGYPHLEEALRVGAEVLPRLGVGRVLGSPSVVPAQSAVGVSTPA